MYSILICYEECIQNIYVLPAEHKLWQKDSSIWHWHDWHIDLSRRRSKVLLADGQETRSKILQGFVELVQREESCRTLLSHATWWWWFPGREKSARWGWGTYQALQGRSWKQPSSLDFIVNWSIADPWIFSRKFPALVYVLVTWSCESSLSSDVPLAVPENFTNTCED